MRKAIIINVFTKYLTVIFQILLNAILARILKPSDFGVLVVINVFASFFLIIADMGVGASVIQNKELDNRDLNCIFSFTVYIALLSGILFIVFSRVIARVYDDQVYVSIGIFFSFSIFFSILNMIPLAILRKEKKFLEIGIRTVLITIFAGSIAIILAVEGLSYYSLVINSLIISIFTFFWNYWKVGLKFKFKINKSSIAKIFEFSSYQFLANIINYFSRNLDNIVVGKFLGSDALGYYDKAYKLMVYPVTYLTHAITPALHPVMSEYQDDFTKIYNQYKKILKILSLFGIFICIFSYFSAEEIILILYGKQWEESIDCFKVLSLSIWSQMLTSSTGAIFQSTGKTKEMFKCGLISSLLIVSFILIGAKSNDLFTLATCVSIAYCINFIITFYILIVRTLKIKLSDFFKYFVPDFFLCLILVLAINICKISFFNIYISFCFKFAYLLFIFIMALIITGQKSVFNILFLKLKK